VSEISPVSSRAPADLADAQFATDVQYYLMQRPRQLPSRYFYDALGSALFEAICRLPWYRITRAETRLLVLHGREIFDAFGHLLDTVVELGGGSGQKLMALVEAGRRTSSRLELRLIDVSAVALASAARALRLLDEVHVVTYEASYEAGLAEIRAARAGSGRTLTLFLGSNIGNFDPPGADAFLRGIHATLARDDGLLIGADLVKTEPALLLAYDDPLGVTAAFNRNLLVRINRELGGDFDVNAFSHRAIWNAGASRVEMHLFSRLRQHVRVPAAGLEFDIEAGESIWTESSYKYQPDDLRLMLERAGFRMIEQWIDGDEAFLLTLVAAV
jgi:dimethylhistidine N-methyltransferase